MLLSEVLQLNKKLKAINESYKSVSLKNILNDINMSSKYSVYRYSNNNRFYSTVNSIVELAYRYIKRVKELDEKWKLAAFNNPETRKKICNNVLYKTPGDSFILNINAKLKEQIGKEFDIANISELYIQDIDITLAKKKPYKEGLQFWIDNVTNELRAVVCNNKIICLVERYKYEDSFISNANFIGNYNIEQVNLIFDELDNGKYELFNDFVNKGFNIIKKYNIRSTTASIRKELDCVGLSITKLIEYFNNSHTYITVKTVLLEGLNETDITEKRLSRQEYKAFVYQERNFLLNQRARYREMLQNIKNKRAADNTENTISQLCNDYLDLLSDVYDVQTDILTGKESNAVDYKYASIPYPSEFLSIVYKTKYLINAWPYSTRNTYNSIYIKNKLDILMVFSVFILVILKNIQDIQDVYNDINTHQYNELEMADKLRQVVEKIKTLKLSVTTKIFSSYTLQKVFAEPTNTNIKSIFIKIELLQKLIDLIQTY